MTWYPYPISFLDFMAERRQRRQEKREWAAKRNGAWSPRIKRSKYSVEATVGSNNSAVHHDDSEVNHGNLAMIDARLRAAMSIDSFATIIHHDIGTELRSALSTETFATDNDTAVNHDNFDLIHTRFRAVLSTETSATADIDNHDNFGINNAKLRATLSTETFATAREYATLAPAADVVAVQGAVEGGSAQKSIGFKDSKVSFKEGGVVGLGDVVVGGTDAQSAVAAHFWPAGSVRTL